MIIQSLLHLWGVHPFSHRPALSQYPVSFVNVSSMHTGGVAEKRRGWRALDMHSKLSGSAHFAGRRLELQHRAVATLTLAVGVVSHLGKSVESHAIQASSRHCHILRVRELHHHSVMLDLVSLLKNFTEHAQIHVRAVHGGREVVVIEKAMRAAVCPEV